MHNAHFGVNFTNKNNYNFTFDYLPQFITFHVLNHNTRFGVDSPYSLLCNSVNKSIETLESHQGCITKYHILITCAMTGHPERTVLLNRALSSVTKYR